MKKILILICLSVILGGCTMTAKEWDNLFWGENPEETLQIYDYLQQQKMYNAQYDYYTRPYEVGGVIHVP